MDCWENVFGSQHDFPIYLIFVLFLGLFLVLIGLIVLAKRSGASVRYFMPTMLLFVCFRLITVRLVDCFSILFLDTPFFGKWERERQTEREERESVCICGVLVEG